MRVGDYIAVKPYHLSAKAEYWKVRNPKFGETRLATVVYINIPHRHCVVQYDNGLREGFKIHSKNDEIKKDYMYLGRHQKKASGGLW